MNNSLLMEDVAQRHPAPWTWTFDPSGGKGGKASAHVIRDRTGEIVLTLDYGYHDEDLDCNPHEEDPIQHAIVAWMCMGFNFMEEIRRRDD